MFTGIVEELGTIEAVEDQGDAIRLTVKAGLVLEDAGLGDSISVNGCCLTVSAMTADAVTAEKRLGGHIVQGHVDGVGHVVSRTPSEHWEVVEVEMPGEMAKYLVDK